MFSFGIIVNGSFSLEHSAQVVKEILTWFSFFGILSIIINYFILKYLNQVTKPLLLGLLISITCFLVSFTFVYIERDKFLENGKGNALEIDVNLVQKIYVKNLNTGQNTLLQKDEREIIWETERLLNYPDNSKGKNIYEVHIKFENGELIFKTNEMPKN